MGSKELTGKVALVTGAARCGGIGRTTALLLADLGADIACLDVARPPEHAPEHGVGSPNELAELVAEIEAKGRRAIAVTADVTNGAQVNEAVDRTVVELGSLDLCCAMAGGVGFGNGIAPLLSLDEPSWDWVIDVNLKGAWLTAAAAGRAMVAAGRGGRIVTIASSAALVGTNGNTGMGVYAAAKAGVITLTQNLAAELGPHGINVNAVSPGMIGTQASAPVREQFERSGRTDAVIGSIPLRRFGEAEEIASIVAFLCGDGASYITGDAINATGGKVLG
ncbi:SDR family oxidoreductase [Streptomyces sp. NBC_00873]|uniref:SDR family NAD(P)-dependent oxidoreductase n=1 Tax=unclassified Streptomyces TaxID=2593676 RepID=UPI0038707C05|nr:SDR family oxidoreductase [Streptomyces sp. NBC_00873]WTA41983.1 SDR family oxidoreductase [Streptomyces sp. NBC_00842]